MFRLASDHAPGAEDTAKSFCSSAEAKLLYTSLRPLPHIQHEIDNFYSTHMSNTPVIGVHIRHGNGEEKVRQHFSRRVIADLDTLLGSLLERINKIAEKQCYKDYRIFLCTDSDTVKQALSKKFPQVISRNIWRPQADTGMDFDQITSAQQGVQSAVDALIDMQLMSMCDVAILTRQTSFGCQVPYIQSKPRALFIDHKKFENIQINA